MDALAGLSGSEGASSSDEEAAAQPVAKKAKAQNPIDLETLRAHGLREGPSVLLVPAKAAGDQSWEW